MHEPDLFDPYAGNVLNNGLGPLLSREQMVERMLDLPPIPKGLKDAPRHVRIHYLMGLSHFYTPLLQTGRLAESIDLLIRTGYLHRDPAAPGTYGTISGEAQLRRRGPPPAAALTVGGPSGCGKSEAIRRCLNLYLSQVIEHASLPPFLGPHTQVAWMSVDVPPSGKAEDLARSLMREWQRVTGTNRFEHWLSKERIRNPLQALDEWRQVAATHFLGVLHLDEVQNFFKLPTLAQRRKRQNSQGKVELSIIEDQLLKWLLTSLNEWGIPLIFSGTPDGMGALGRRMSTLQRLATFGSHAFGLFESVEDAAYSRTFLVSLGKYQYTSHKIPVDNVLGQHILNLSGGVPRIIIALWVAANRIALEREEDRLLLSDFQEAADTYLLPLKPAVAVLRSRDPLRLAEYEDLVSRDPSFWTHLWSNVDVSSG